MEDCLFCAIAEGRSPSWRVYEDARTMAFMDINPATEGHTLVIPRRHSQDLWDVEEVDARAVMDAALRVAGMIRRALSPDGLNILHASGAAAFQTVFHYHLHLVPRYRGDRVHLPWVRTPAPPAALQATAERITSAAFR